MKSSDLTIVFVILKFSLKIHLIQNMHTNQLDISSFINYLFDGIKNALLIVEQRGSFFLKWNLSQVTLSLRPPMVLTKDHGIDGSGTWKESLANKNSIIS